MISAASPDAPRAAVAEKLSHPARLMRSFYSADWKDETKELLILSWPVVCNPCFHHSAILIGLPHAKKSFWPLMLIFGDTELKFCIF